MFSPKIVTLNIESTDLRFLVAQGRRVVEWGSLPLEPGLVKEGLILNPTALSGVLSQLVAEQGVKGKEVIASLSGFQSLQRFSVLPRLPQQLMRDAISREMKRVMPVPTEELYLSWQTVSDGKETEQVFLLGIPRNLMDAAVQCLRQSGITPRIMDLKPLALARMVSRPEALVIDVETESSDIIVISDGFPAIMRTITLRPDYPLDKRVQYLVEESVRVLQFYNNNHPDKPVNAATPLFFTGGLGSNVELVQAVAAGMGYQVETLVAPLECPADLPLAQYAVNLGLALKLSSRGSQGIAGVNILPDIYLPRRLSPKELLVVPGILAGIALLFPLFRAADFAITENHRAQAEYSSLEQQVQLRQQENRKVKEIEDAIALAQQRKEKLEASLRELSWGRLEVYARLHVVAVSALPADASLISVKMESSGLRLHGVANSSDVALGYADALRQTQRFSNVRINSIVSNGKESVGFDITLK